MIKLEITNCECGGEYKYIGDTYLDGKTTQIYDVYECENCKHIKNIKNRD